VVVIGIRFEPDRLSGEHATWFARWERRAARAYEGCQREMTAGRTPNLDAHAAVWQSFKAWMLDHFLFGKCAYCEGDLTAQTTGASEHWRPKARVDQFDDAGTAHIVRNGDGPHRGYWWLAFSWQNLVPACPNCNRHKGTVFQIAGTRAFEPDESLDLDALDARELPLLLHPHRGEDPVRHVGFLPDGQAFAKNGSAYGSHTIQALKLNRHGLRRQRAQQQEAAKNALALALVDALRGEHEEVIRERTTPYRGPRARYSRAVEDALAPSRLNARQLLDDW
jgi:5-methylcytosine-specific restriction endonuclease McrA